MTDKSQNRRIVLPMCKESVEDYFLAELRELLGNYRATIEAEDHYCGYPECGEDIRMTVEIPAIYDDEGELVRERCSIDLGSYFDADAKL